MSSIGKRIFLSGIQPTGKLHIGNYLGAIKNWVNLQNKHQDATHLYCIVDLHALCDKFKSEDHDISFDSNISNDSITMAATLIASGLDINRSILFLQSSVPQHAELQWILSCIAPQNWLNKMTQYKEKQTKASSLGLYTYPVLMAADIMLYNATHVPVGEDQKQHVELCRDYITRYNHLFCQNQQQWNVCNYVEAHFARVMSLRDASKKMSKSDLSDYSRINLTDNHQQIVEKIRKAKTDSISNFYYDENNRPELSNLIKIYSEFSGDTISEIELKYKEQDITAFKSDLAQVIAQEIQPISTKTLELISQKKDLVQYLKVGSEKAISIAQKNLDEIKQKVGLLKLLQN